MAPFTMSKLLDKQAQVVAFSSTAIALYGYDQGMWHPLVALLQTVPIVPKTL